MYELREVETDDGRWAVIVVGGEEYFYTGPRDEASIQEAGDRIARTARSERLHLEGVTLAALELDNPAETGHNALDSVAFWLQHLDLDCELDLTADQARRIATRILSNRPFTNYVIAAMNELAITGSRADYIEGGPLDVALQQARQLTQAVSKWS